MKILRNNIEGRESAPDDPDFLRFLGEFDDGGRIDKAPERLKWPEYFGARKIEQRDKHWQAADWAGVDPRLRKFAVFLCAYFEKQQVPFYVYCARRTSAEQWKHVRNGTSKAKPPSAAHVKGAAVDIINPRYAWGLTKAEWNYLGLTAKVLHERLMSITKKEERWQLVWGGDWKFYDPAHFEIKGWQASHQAIDDRLKPVRQTIAYYVEKRKLLGAIK